VLRAAAEKFLKMFPENDFPCQSGGLGAKMLKNGPFIFDYSPIWVIQRRPLKRSNPWGAARANFVGVVLQAVLANPRKILADNGFRCKFGASAVSKC